MSMDQIQEYRCPLSPVGETPLSPAYSASKRWGGMKVRNHLTREKALIVPLFQSADRGPTQVGGLWPWSRPLP